MDMKIGTNIEALFGFVRQKRKRVLQHHDERMKELNKSIEDSKSSIDSIQIQDHSEEFAQLQKDLDELLKDWEV